MRMLLNVIIPNEKFNQAMIDGTIGAKMSRILEETKPEAVYFTEQHGKRGAYLVVDVASPESVAALGEPWFLTFDAEVRFQIVMRPEDLKKAGLEELGKRYAK